jgi:raffinose/stachyose/melibiose transport system permease protein
LAQLGPKRVFARNIFLYAIVIAVSALMFFPMVWMFYTSLKTNSEIYASAWALPESPQFGNFLKAWAVGHLGRYVWNSILCTSTSVLAIVVLSSLAAFAFSRLTFRGRDPLFALFLLGLIIPVQIVLIPLYSAMAQVGLQNTRTSVILPYIAWGLPLSIYILRAFFLTLPAELEDAARIDGCGTFGLFWRILIPLVKPGIATVTIFSSLGIWNEVLLAFVFLKDDVLKTLPLGLYAFYGYHITDLSLLFAALTVVTVPMIALFLIFQRQLIEGLTVGSLKG